MAEPRGDGKNRGDPGGRGADRRRNPLLHHEPKEVSRGVPEAVHRCWAIENQLHWVPAVQMGEDEVRNRADDGPKNLAVIRRVAPDIVRRGDDKRALRRRLRRAAQAPEYRIELIRKTAEIAAEN